MISPPTPEEIARCRTFAEVRRLYAERQAAIEQTPRGKAIKDRRLAARLELLRRGRPCYLRFGYPPPDGRSVNGFDGSKEAGLSVFAAYEVDSGRFVVDHQENLMLGALLAVYLLHPERAGWRPVFEVAGRRIGTGSGGEPLLAAFTLKPVPRWAVTMLPLGLPPRGT